ncbi:Piso0_000758 [Millerozyma farinosa CBS 7064]|uniref:Piso0_000758 protein n=1 Tax=Pichia sorbitophila (strain ATCC MYA-4447 / BCRC 22081 / CBS 7064 / NBRC 10061 / NRRL Y-12695) TaxID=559304 RepID=G8YPZ4_PICSO|nr:Piso0_000758 [Millerozyma farinosa CBS 7064]
MRSSESSVASLEQAHGPARKVQYSQDDVEAKTVLGPIAVSNGRSPVTCGRSQRQQTTTCHQEPVLVRMVRQSVAHAKCRGHVECECELELDVSISCLQQTGTGAEFGLGRVFV